MPIKRSRSALIYRAFPLPTSRIGSLAQPPRTRPNGRLRSKTGSASTGSKLAVEEGHGTKEVPMKSMLLLALGLSVLLVPWAASARADISAGEVRDSIDRGVAYLKREQRDDGSWPDPVGYPGGITSLCTLALLNCGVPPEDEQ